MAHVAYLGRRAYFNFVPIVQRQIGLPSSCNEKASMFIPEPPRKGYNTMPRHLAMESFGSRVACMTLSSYLHALRFILLGGNTASSVRARQSHQESEGSVTSRKHGSSSTIPHLETTP